SPGLAPYVIEWWMLGAGAFGIPSLCNSTLALGGGDPVANQESEVSLPHRPETWLSFVLHRAEKERDVHLSPEDVGGQMGVSGATVRRWENGRAVPTEEDLVRLGEICGLSSQQVAFLRIAFRGRLAPLPPDRATFRATTQNLL